MSEIQKAIVEFYQRKLDKLLEWRERYSKEEYPYKIIQNLFYDLFATQEIWAFIVSSFESLDKMTEKPGTIKDAFNTLAMKKRQTALEYIHPRLMQLLKNNVQIAGEFCFSDLETEIRLAQNGDNSAVERVEFTYIFEELVDDSIYLWATFGLLGRSKEDAFYEVTGALHGSMNFESYKSTRNAFSLPIGMFLDSNVQKLYKPLDKLWE